MHTIEHIKGQIQKLYQTNPHIHMDITLKKPKLTLISTEATLTGVFPNIFQIEECTTGRKRLHTLRYTDVMIGSVVIKELSHGNHQQVRA